MTFTRPVKAIAFYLPQFHPIPENDVWWGEGFTEWTNAARCQPGFRGHQQPHLPADLGFYDLRLEETRCAQAELAAEYGIHGFCYYHYWFNGRRVLERPFTEVLASGRPDFPFCLCWANENWTRAWDGRDREVLLEQCYSDDDDLAHLRALAPAFSDSRYIRIGGKPLFAVYRATSMPNPRRTADIWREEAERLGIGELYLCQVESFPTEFVDPATIGFDAAIEFAPDWSCLGPALGRGRIDRWLSRIDRNRRFAIENAIYSYDRLRDNMLAKPTVDYIRYRCVTPMWDNTARRSMGALVLEGANPQAYASWLRQVICESLSHSREPVVFINAWNEWAEGNHLEPCTRWGRKFLEATVSEVLHMNKNAT